MTTAQRIAQRMAGRPRGKNAIYTVVSDDQNVIRHTEATLDAWWNSLAPEDKGALYELHLDGILDPPAVTVCKLRMPRDKQKRAAFLESMAAMAHSGRLMLEAQQVLDARGAAIHG